MPPPTTQSTTAPLTPVEDTTPAPAQADGTSRLRQIRQLVKDNNKSALDTDLIVCQIFMESRFDANAGAGQNAHGLMQMQKQGVQQVYKYRLQKQLGHMPSDAQTQKAFAEGAALHASDKIYDEATNIQIGTEYMRYWMEISSSTEEAYKRYRGLSNGIYYKKIRKCADELKQDPDSMDPLRRMVK